MSEHELDQKIIESRKKKFAVAIEDVRHPFAEGEIRLMVTHNGYQWSSMSLLPDEAKQVIATLQSRFPSPTANKEQK